MSRKPRKPKDQHAPKKPQNAYFIFMNERFRILKDENKDKPMIQISKLISNEWRTLTDKSKYEQQANKLKLEYNIKLNKYKRSDNFKAYQQKLSEWEAINSMTELKKELGSLSLKRKRKRKIKSDLLVKCKNKEKIKREERENIIEQSLKKKKQIHESAPNTNENINANDDSASKEDENDSAFITSRKRSLKELKCIPNQPKIKRQRTNNNVNNIDYNCNIEQTRMKVEEIEKLEKGDSIDHQCLTGKYMEAKIIGKWNSSWEIQYINNSEKYFSDYTDQYELHKFAKYKSISNRPAHRLPHLTIGDNVYLNLKQTFARNDKISNLGWIKCVIQKRDIGQIQLKFKWKTIEYTYWIHLDDKEIISDDADWVEKHMKHSRYIPQLMRNQIAFKQDWKCSCCDAKLNVSFQIHHDIEVNKGGTNDMRNLRAINPECHINTHRNINGNNSNEMKCWLKDKCKLPQYFDTFIENDINDMEIVQELDKNDLQQMGIVSLGHQKKLLKYIKKLKD